jgi:ADP-dependent NAD(P)H-hydrate dehydratase
LSQAATPINEVLLADMPMPALPAESDKNDRGRVLVVAGGARVPGAALLTGLAALRVGAGKLKLAATASVASGLGLAVPEALIVSVAADDAGEIALAASGDLGEALGASDALVVGPGMMGKDTVRLAVRLAAQTGAVVALDAGALSGLLGEAAALSPCAGRLVLTPHAGEMAALTGWDRTQIESEPAVAALDVARALQAVVVLKGVATYVASPEGRLWRHEGGVIGLGTSGSGDVLVGVIAGLAARGASAAEAAIRGVFVHGLAGRILSDEVGPLGFLAREILEVLPRALIEAHGLPAG